LFWEADKQYRAFFAEFIKMEEAGGYDKLPAAFDKYVMGEYKSALANLAKNIKKDQTVIVNPGKTKLVYVAPLKNKVPAETVIALVSCADARDTIYKYPKEQLKGVVHQRVIHFKRDSDGLLKIYASTIKELKSCAS